MPASLFHKRESPSWIIGRPVFLLNYLLHPLNYFRMFCRDICSFLRVITSEPFEPGLELVTEPWNRLHLPLD